MTPSERATAIQRLGADPSNSAFVMANAGSGKTRVLTDRVARLLLERVDPQQILCITFTKAAAAEMADRLFTTLGGWALMEDDALRGKLVQLDPDADAWSAGDLADVRRLFARALETPGGLKIQTIHSFCESVLRRFPLEAGVAPGFSVIEEAEAAALAAGALDALAQDSEDDALIAADMGRLSVLRPEKDLRAFLDKETRAGLTLGAMFARHDGVDGAVRALAAELDVDPNDSEASVKETLIASIDGTTLAKARDALHDGGKQARERNADPITTFLSAETPEQKWKALSKLFLKSNGDPRGKYGDKPINSQHPWVQPYLIETQDSFIAATGRLKALAIYDNTAACYRVVAALRETYEAAKASRAALDFDDLIAKAVSLLETEAAAWVRYKLDFGIDHILVDETQDTSPPQWRVIEALVDDYLSGASISDAPRTFFAVGDVKQSIYSFQGADADVFQAKEEKFGESLAAYHQNRARGAYHNLAMQVSFRTTAPVLAFVDEVFRDEQAAEGLGRDRPPPHISNRADEAGLVELWPLTPRPETEKANAWDKPVDAPAANHPAQVLSARIANTIRRWLDEGEILESTGRPVTPGDILILVQSRGDLFDLVLDALSREGVPVAGADRLKLIEDPAVEDLLSFAKFCVLSRDDLSLAETLKSPLFGFDDDNDLFPLAYEREDNESLWRALHKRRDENTRWSVAAEEIANARGIGLREGPYAFLSHVLESAQDRDGRSGRKRFYRRLTTASRESLDEMLRQALAFERSNPRSLRSFINWFEENAGVVNREMDRSDDAVRVMTVHSAKGLEGNIVFLIDAHRPPNEKDIGFPLEMQKADAQAPESGRLRLLVGGKDGDTPGSAAARGEKKRQLYEEYRRLFYVATTRARDRLYIAGIERGNDKNPRGKPTVEKSWHSLAADAFDRLGGRIETGADAFWPGGEAEVQRLSHTQTAKVKRRETPPAEQIIETPDWLFAPAAPEAAKPRLSPSRLAEAEEADEETPVSSAAYSPAGGDAYFRGRVLHRLLELLPDIAPDARARAASRLLQRLAPELSNDVHDEWRAEVLAVLSDPRFGDVFGPGSRAEVAIAGDVNGKIVTGQIDRLILKDREILIVDYKTNRPPPKTVEETAPAYLAQMAAYKALLQEIYPDHQIACALLWTFEARLSALPESLLSTACRRWLAPG
jgi:ATP-dependent helicase/nuclease subunit A